MKNRKMKNQKLIPPAPPAPAKPKPQVSTEDWLEPMMSKNELRRQLKEIDDWEPMK